MKTKDEKKIVPSFDELVFENRNTEYGAYQIRKKYNSALLWAMLVGLFFINASVITPFVIFKGKPIVVEPVKESPPVIFTSTPVETITPEQVKPEKQIVQIPRYTVPIVVDSITLENHNELAMNGDLDKIVKNDSIIEETPKPNVEIEPEFDNKIVEFYDLSEKPSFGIDGVNGFRKWIAQNIQYPEAPLAAGIQGRVYVQFVIEKDGSLSNIMVARSVDPDLDKEAIRVLQLSPKWNPGKQQGKPVRVNYTFPITFSIK